MPTIEYNDDDIIWDVYFTIIQQPTPEKQRGRFSDTKSEEYKKDLKEFEDFAKKLEKSTNEVFMYHITNSVETITDEILTWLEGEVFPFFENDETKKYDNLLKTLNNLDESGIQSEPQINKVPQSIIDYINLKGI